MKKRILALVCATVMVLGMSLSVCAAGSASAGSVSTPAKAEEVLVSNGANGQTFGTDSLEYFAEDTKVEGATVKAVTTDEAKRILAFTNQTYGNGTFVASIFDLTGKTGEITATCSNVWKGQNIAVVHETAPGVFETLKATVVADNKFTFTVNSNSPFAVVVLGTAPKTGEIIAMIAAFAAISGIGAAACAKKAKND